MNKEVFIIRHGQTDLNKDHIVQGSGVDSSLNAYGRKQAAAFYKLYKNQAFEVVLTSALKRTHETVAPFLERGLPWEQHPSINEIS